MTEAKAETKKKAAPAKKAAAPKTAAAPKAKTAKTTTAKSGDKKTLTVVQTGSRFGGKPGMKETLAGLGLGKRHASRVLEDTPAVRGMIWKVRHLVKVEGEE